MSNFIANLPLYFGVLLKTLSDYYVDLSVKLHIKFNTEIGKSIISFREEVKKYKEIVEQQSQVDSEDKKLVNMLKGKSSVTH